MAYDNLTTNFEYSIRTEIGADELRDTIDSFAGVGWKLHTAFQVPYFGYTLIFERLQESQTFIPLSAEAKSILYGESLPESHT